MSVIQEKIIKYHQAWLAYYANFGSGAQLAAQIKIEDLAKLLKNQMQYAEKLIDEEMEYVTGLLSER